MSSRVATIVGACALIGTSLLASNSARAECAVGQWKMAAPQYGITNDMEIRRQGGHLVIIGNWGGELYNSHVSGNSFTVENRNGYGSSSYRGTCAGPTIAGSWTNTLGGGGAFVGTLVGGMPGGAAPAANVRPTKSQRPQNCIDATGLPGYSQGSMRCENDTGAEQTLREARSLMNLARSVARYHTYEEQMKAAEQYTNAAEAFNKAGRSNEARQAMALANKASADADRYQRAKNAEGTRRNRPDGSADAGGGSGRKGDPNALRNQLKKCMALRSHLGSLEHSDLAVDREAFEEQMKNNGCST
jgi:hypothetical protein